MGGLDEIEKGVLVQERQGPHRTSPYLIPSLIPNMAAGMLALDLKLAVPQITLVGGCASGIQALGMALDAVRAGRATWALAGGSEAVITPITFSGLQAMGIASPRSEIGQVPRPFDRDRDGMIVSEGAAVLLVEEFDAARNRGAPILAELSGYASTSVTTRPFHQCSEAGVRCMHKCLEDAGVQPSEVDCIYAHSGGLESDVTELQSIDALWPRLGPTPALTSTKGHMGYAFAATGPMDVVAAILALREQRVSPTLNFAAPPPDYAHADVVSAVREQRLRHCLINSFGLGGVHASLLVSRN